MGGVVSRLTVKFSADPKTVELPGNINDDPRSPSDGISRTPLALDKRKPYLETDIDSLTPTLPLRVRMLKKLADPRSPTEGIDRTPIALINAQVNFESPVSLYSNYQNEATSFSYLDSPRAEPSVNVSGFEEDKFSRDLDILVEQLDKSLSESVIPIADELTGAVDEAKIKLSLNDDYSKKTMCDELIHEIIDSFKEYEEEIRNTKPRPQRKLKLVAVPASNQVADVKSLPKKRKPLSNITSAGNTPTRYNNLKKEEKIKVEMAGENSPVPMIGNSKIRAQWDHDSTVII